ncbi:MAG: hypothetical protein SX243_25350, partial [Acidobacteriota bacterium]|nr:hypothetical protein [Acidobacteriota bacterium]
AEHQLMLFNLSVLEYQNHKRWCDVHPAVLSLPAFQEALRRGSEEVGAGQAPQAEEGTTNQDEDE